MLNDKIRISLSLSTANHMVKRNQTFMNGSQIQLLHNIWHNYDHLFLKNKLLVWSKQIQSPHPNYALEIPHIAFQESNVIVINNLKIIYIVPDSCFYFYYR